jgi:hypothetical protein
LFYKLNIPYTRDQETRVINDFKAVEDGLPSFLEPSNHLEEQLLSTARKIILRVLANSDPLSGTPRHGPGAVATGEKNSPETKHQKMVLSPCGGFPL